MCVCVCVCGDGGSQGRPLPGRDRRDISRSPLKSKYLSTCASDETSIYRYGTVPKNID